MDDAGLRHTGAEPDLDETRRAARRPQALRAAPDVDETIVRGREAPPPALVEPPAPAPPPRPRPLAPADPVPAEPVPVAEFVQVAESVQIAEPDTVEVPAAVAPTPVAALRAVFPDGTELPIDAPIYVGRRPAPPRIPRGPEPRLVTLASPLRELSATHLELRVVGGTVVASDARSTNGTIVQLPGAAPRSLIRGESVVVVAGTRIDLGEGVVIEILPPNVADHS